MEQNRRTTTAELSTQLQSSLELEKTKRPNLTYIQNVEWYMGNDSNPGFEYGLDLDSPNLPSEEQIESDIRSIASLDGYSIRNYVADPGASFISVAFVRNE